MFAKFSIADCCTPAWLWFQWKIWYLAIHKISEGKTKQSKHWDSGRRDRNCGNSDYPLGRIKQCYADERWRLRHYSNEDVVVLEELTPTAHYISRGRNEASKTNQKLSASHGVQKESCTVVQTQPPQSPDLKYNDLTLFCKLTVRQEVGGKGEYH